MAISAVSSISVGDFVRLFRAPPIGSFGRGPAVRRVETVAALANPKDTPVENARREAALPSKGGALKAGGGRSDFSRRSALDPRRPEALFSARRAEQNGRRSAHVMGMLSQLRARDSQVRAHEAAHMAAAGRYITGAASYTYQQGPDGGEYAIGGEVDIDTSPVPGNPEETAQKMRTIRAAALAPGDPSGPDLSVAAAATEAESTALAQIAQSRAEELAGRYSQGAAAPRDASPRGPINMIA